MARAPLIACPQCDTLHEREAVPPGGAASCVQCEYTLYRQSRLSLDGWIALTITALLVFAIANIFPIVTLNLAGRVVQVTLVGAMHLIWQQGHPILSAMTGLFAFWVPLAQLFCVLWALLAIRGRHLPADFRIGMRILHWAEPWSMIPVLVLGILIASVKFAGIAKYEPEPGLWAFGILAFLLTGLSRVSAYKLWRYAEDQGIVRYTTASDWPAGTRYRACLICGYVHFDDAQAEEVDRCPRCHAALFKRKPASHRRTWALIITASILYFPANLLPIMYVATATDQGSHNILGGVMELWRLGSPDLAIIVFVASIVVPVTKLLVLSLLLLVDRWRSVAIQRQRTRLFEFVEFIGLWSMLDVFVVVLMVAMADFPGLSQIRAEPGAATFGMVVIVTMLAAMNYDPRLGWDKKPAGEAPAPEAEGARAKLTV